MLPFLSFDFDRVIGMLTTQLKTWCSLSEHAHEMQVSAFHSDLTEKKTLFELKTQGLTLDYSRQKISQKTVRLLLDLAIECQLEEKIQDLLKGALVNKSQHLPALHSALRLPEGTHLYLDGEDIVPEIVNVRHQMRDIAEQIRAGQWLGYSGKPVTSIVNIGIGGSDFGPRFCLSALSEYSSNELNYHFISDCDPKFLTHILKKLNPETTLFIVSSKSFTTPETLHNAHQAMIWLGDKNRFKNHFIAVTAQPLLAKAMGIDHVLKIWSWVGGRFSFCSAINLITCIAMGYSAFMSLLTGAHSMDQHFSDQPLEANMPVLLALLGIWNVNFLHISSLLLWAYTKDLELFIPYIQQLDMESNGKSIDINGHAVNYATGPIVWGGLGNQAQHSYYQLMCQGTHKVAVDCIVVDEFKGEMINELSASQMHVLSRGVPSLEHPNGYIPGGVPINQIRLEACTPFILGQLIALYEHKIYVQSVLWHINAFDQPGVESAKKHHTIPKVIAEKVMA